MNVTITNLNSEEVTKLMLFISTLRIGSDRNSEVRFQTNDQLNSTEGVSK